MGDKALRGNKLTARRTWKSLGGFLKGAKEIAKKVFTKKKPVKKDFKTDLSKLPTSKNINELIAKEQDPFVRNKLISLRNQAEKGDVISKSGTVIGTLYVGGTAPTTNAPASAEADMHGVIFQTGLYADVTHVTNTDTMFTIEFS